MSVLRPRNRLVYFRVSEDEFERFNHICEAMGARSISDLARSAVQSMIQDSNNGHADRVTEKLTALEAMVNDLNDKVHQLSLSLGKAVSHATELSMPARVNGRIREVEENEDI